MTSEYAQSRIAEARTALADLRSVCCRHGVTRDRCNDCAGSPNDAKATAPTSEETTNA